LYRPRLGPTSPPSWSVISAGSLYFSAADLAHGRELWTLDVTSDRPILVRDIRPGAMSSNATHLTFFKGALYFAANDGISGVELWTSDGTAAGTTMVKDIRAGSTSSRPAELAAVGDTLYFAANDG